MPRELFPRVLMLLVVVFLWGCAQTPSSVTTPSSDDAAVAIEDGAHASQWQSEWVREIYLYKCDPIPLMAGQTIKVGEVTLTIDEMTLYVKYETWDGWFMTVTHMHIAKSVDDIPQAEGNPIPGLFDYQTVHDPPVQEYEYVVDLCAVGNGDWVPEDEIVITAHADVQKEVEGEEDPWEETAWAGDEDCYDFYGANWGKYCTCTIKCVMENCLVKLPGSPVTAQFKVFNACHFDPPRVWGFWEWVVLGSVPPEYSVWDGWWIGWCLEQRKEIANQLHVPPQPKIYTVALFSSQGSYLPRDAARCDWERINYILNHKHPSATKCEIQQAMWYFTPDGHPNLDPLAQVMVNDALQNGGGYHPGANSSEIEAAILDAGPDYQMTFIEVGCIPVKKPCENLCPYVTMVF